MEIYMPMVVLFRNFIDLNFRASDLQSRGVNLFVLVSGSVS
nr:unknown [Medicago truncatula]